MICVIAKLPPDAVERLNALRQAVVSAKQPVKPLHGHITVATYLPDNNEGFIQVCSKIVRETPSFSVRYEKLEVLHETSIIVAAPSKPEALRSLHSRIAEQYGDSLDRWTRGAGWYPHTTLLYDPVADLDVLCRNMQRYFTPFETCISQIEFSKVEESGYTVLESVDLMQKSRE